MNTTSRTRRITPRSAQQWGAVLPTYLGLFGLTIQLGFWMVTYIQTGEGATSAPLLTAFGSLLAVGQGAQAVVQARQPPPSLGEDASPER